MTQIVEIQEAIRHLAPTDLAQFRNWFIQFDAAAWDQQFEHDAGSGRLNPLAMEALQDFRKGRFIRL